MLSVSILPDIFPFISRLHSLFLDTYRSCTKCNTLGTLCNFTSNWTWRNTFRQSKCAACMLTVKVYLRIFYFIGILHRTQQYLSYTTVTSVMWGRTRHDLYYHTSTASMLAECIWNFQTVRNKVRIPLLSVQLRYLVRGLFSKPDKVSVRLIHTQALVYLSSNQLL